jgi:hypothetical protein
VTESVRERISGDPGSLSPSQLVEAQKAVDRAYQRLVDGDYAAASASAEEALGRYASAPAVLAHEEVVRALEFKALMIAARSAQVLGRNDDAFRWMAEAIRSFGSQAPSATEFDPSVIALYSQVRNELKRQGVGALEINVSDPAVTVFLDERFVGSGHVSFQDLSPGMYRVLVAKGSQDGRVHQVQVPPGGHASLDIAWELDAAVSTTSGVTTLAAHGDDLADAIRLGRALGAPRVVVLGIRYLGGRRAVVGYGIDVESQRRSYAAVQVEPLAPPEETMHRLAALLAGDENVSTSDLITREPESGSSSRHGLGPRRSTALLIGGLALVAGGAAVGFDVYAHDAYDASAREGNNDRQNALFDTANRRYHVAQGLAVAAGVGVVAAVTLWLVSPAPPEREERTSLAPIVSPSQVGVAVMGRF